MTEKEQKFTAKQVAEIIERQHTLEALEHAINRGRAAGDYAGLINPLVNIYNAVLGAGASQEQPAGETTEEKPGDEE